MSVTAVTPLPSNGPRLHSQTSSKYSTPSGSTRSTSPTRQVASGSSSSARIPNGTSSNYASSLDRTAKMPPATSGRSASSKPGSSSRPSLRTAKSSPSIPASERHHRDAPSLPVPAPSSPHQAYFDKYPKRAERIATKGKEKEEYDGDVAAISPTVVKISGTAATGTSGSIGTNGLAVPERRDNINGRRPHTAPGLEPDSIPAKSTLRTRAPKVLAQDTEADADTETTAVYAWPSKVDTSRHTRRAPSTSKHHIDRYSSASTSSSSPSSSPRTTPAHPLPPLHTAPPLNKVYGSSHVYRPFKDYGLTPPHTPNGKSALLLDSGPLTVASGFDVSNMDALVDEMNGDYNEMGDLTSFSSGPWGSMAGKRSGAVHHPLYHPPLPAPPQGVQMGGRVHVDESPATPSSSSHEGTRAGSLLTTHSRVASTVSSTPPSLFRPRGVSDLSTISSTMSTMTVQTEPQVNVTNPSVDDFVRDNGLIRHTNIPPPPLPPKSPQFPSSIVPSITEIIRTHAPEQVKSKSRTNQLQGYSNKAKAKTTFVTAVSESDELENEPRTSMDSIAEEALRSVSVARKFNPSLHHAKSFPSRPPTSPNSNSRSKGYGHSHLPPSPISGQYPYSEGGSVYSSGTNPNYGTPIAKSDRSESPTREMAQYLRSPRLTRLLTLRRHPNVGLTVSLADVGSSTGHPVIMYLGLGCVRYIIGLYDEMAEAMGLRLVCIDRWGLGRTDEVPNENRGMLEWAAVVEEVADTLGLERFSVVAHSAGSPYAIASALRLGSRVLGSVHLLAPFVSMSVDGGYKWLKYVPSGLIKTAQTAEWKVQGWKIGKPPTIPFEGIGFDRTAPVSSNQHLDAGLMSSPTSDQNRPSYSASDYDDLADFNGRYGSSSTLATNSASNHHNKDQLPRDSPEDAKLKKKASKSSFLGFFERPASIKSIKSPRNTSRPTSGRSDTAPAATATWHGDASEDVGYLKQLRGTKSKSSLRSKNGRTPPSRIKTEPPPAVPKVAQAFTGLGLDLAQFGERNKDVSEWGAKVAASTIKARGGGGGTPNKGSCPPTPDIYSPSPRRTSFDRQSGNRSISLSPHSPPTPPLPFYAFNYDELSVPPSPNVSISTRTTTQTSPGATAASATKSQKPGGISLASALMRASHAEALKGGSADLLSILERGEFKPWGFSYTDLKRPVKVWYGDRDEKIGIGSVRWMERAMDDCTLKIVKGEGHSLMTNARIVVEVLESVAKEWDTYS